MTDPAAATRMTVEKLTQKQKKQRASQLKAAQAASQVSIAEAFKRMTQHSQPHAPVIHSTQPSTPPTASKKHTKRLSRTTKKDNRLLQSGTQQRASHVLGNRNRCCLSRCDTSLDPTERDREMVKKCHFCSKKCHLKCIAFDQESSDRDHVQAY